MDQVNFNLQLIEIQLIINNYCQNVAHEKAIFRSRLISVTDSVRDIKDVAKSNYWGSINNLMNILENLMFEIQV